MNGLLYSADSYTEYDSSENTAKCSTCGVINTWNDCSYQLNIPGGELCVTCVGGFVCGMTCVEACLDACNNNCSGGCKNSCGGNCKGGFLW